MRWAAAIASGFHLCLPSCCPWFESQAYLPTTVFPFCIIEVVMRKRTKKWAGIGPIFLKKRGTKIDF